MNETDRLIVFLQDRAKKGDRAMLASLRRGLGKPAGTVSAMYPYIVPFVGESNRWMEPHYYLIASLFALHPVSTNTGNIGDHLKIYSKAKGMKTVDEDDATTRRFVQLLRQNRDALDTPLRQHINLLKSQDIPVNWNQLLNDLRYWSHEDSFVQQKWAKSFWG